MRKSRVLNRSVTIRDVARSAKASPATVSRVLNGYAHVRPNLRVRILHSVSLLGYRPDHVARSLARRETQTVGLIVADITNPFSAETARAIVEKVGDRGYHVIFCNTDNQRSIHEEYLGVFRDRRVDGMVLGSVPLRDALVEAMIDSEYPCIMYNRRLRSGRGNYIVLDNARGSYELTRHLIALGHCWIGFVSGLPDMSVTTDRVQGYKEALEEAGLAVERALMQPGAFRRGVAETAARELLKGRNRPTAVVAANDLMALGVMQTAEEMGLRIPHDLALVGFDDIDIAGHRRIELTTMAQPTAEIGRLVGEGILEIINDPKRFAREPLQQVLTPKLIIRRTCGALGVTRDSPNHDSPSRAADL
jgi:LacI family transcriptional regulator